MDHEWINLIHSASDSDRSGDSPAEYIERSIIIRDFYQDGNHIPEVADRHTGAMLNFPKIVLTTFRWARDLVKCAAI